MWVCQVQRLLAQSTRLTSSKLPLLQHTVCQGCLRRQFSQNSIPHYAVLGNLRRVPTDPYGVFKRLLATVGDQGEDTASSTAKSSSSGTSGPKGTGDISSQVDTLVKGRQLKKNSKKPVQATAKAKPARKKTDFNKDYPDNIYVESDRAKYEYMLTDEQLSQLPVIQRRSPYPGSDNIKVYHRSHIMNKVNEVWGSMENLHIEKQQRKKWENIDAYLFSLRTAQQTYKIQHAGKDEEKPFIFKPYEKPSAPRVSPPSSPPTMLKREFEKKGESSTYMLNLVDVKDPPKTESIFKTGPGKVVMWAITVNGLNVIAKFMAWVYTGSHSMFSECIHSMADTVNQIILAVGIHQSLKQPDLEHPYGWANFRNVASLISGVGIFCLGAGFSIYHGIMGLLNPHTMDSLYWGMAVLGGSFLSEGATLLIAIKEVRLAAKRENMSFRNYVWLGRDPSTNVVLLEDAAAVLGVSIAATCMGITYFTNNPVADAIGAIVIGSLLGSVASFIIYSNTIALVGRSIPIDQKAKLMAELENDRMIRALHDVKATDMGGSSVRFKAEVDFDGKEVTRSYLEKSDLDTLLREVQGMSTSEELEVFMLKHGENIVDTLGGEVDRIEKNLKKRHPEVRHVDLEQL